MTTTGDDCYFFYYSHCSKGSSCPYRHVEAARGNEVTCINWKQGYCSRQNCAFRHMEITKNRSEIACYWESQPSGCQKPHCPFRHINKPTADSVPPASTSLINKIPTIVGPVTKPLPPVVTPAISSLTMVAPIVQAPTAHSLDDLQGLPTVSPVVVHPMDSEDDESLGTMSADGSPGKKVILSPLRPSLGQEKISPRRQTTIRPTIKARPVIAQEKPTRSFGIKTLAEIRREKNLERGHVEEEKQEEEEDKEMEEEEEEQMFPSLSRRIIAVSNSSTRKMNVEENAVKPLSQKVVKVSLRIEKPGVKSLAQLREERFKRLGSSLDQEEGEKGNLAKRIKVVRKDPDTEKDQLEEAPKKTLMRRVMIGGGGGERKPIKESDASGLDSIKIKTVAEIKTDRLKDRLGKRVGRNDQKDDKVSSSVGPRGRLAARLGQIVRTVEEDKGSKSAVQESSTIKKTSLANRLGKVITAIEDGAAGDSSADLATRRGRIAARLGKASAEAGEGDNPRVGIMIKSLAEIKREKLLRRLGKPVSDSEGEDGVSDKEKETSSQEQEEEEEEEDSEEEEESDEEKPSGDIRIKTLAEIRQEKQSRLPVPSQSTEGPDRDNMRGAQKKVAQSAAERRNKRRGEIALYKPPAAARGLKENKVSVIHVGQRRPIETSEDVEKVSEKPAIKVRRLNLSKSVENANKGTDSVLTVIKQKKDVPKDDAPAIKIKSLAEIRAERQRLSQKADASGGESGASEGEEQKEDEKEDEKKEERKREEEEKQRERRAKIWSRSPVKAKTEDPVVKEKTAVVKEGGEEKKSLDEIRRERRARLWNMPASSDDAVTKPIIRRPGGQVIMEADSAPQIKIKTLAEIRREKQQLREQQESGGDQVSRVTALDSVQGGSERTDSAPVKEPETGNLSSSTSTSEVDTDADSSRESAPVSQAASISSSSLGTKLTRKPLQRRRGRQVSNTSQGDIQSTPSSTGTNIQYIQPEPQPQLVSSSVPVTASVLMATVEVSKHVASSKEPEVSRPVHEEGRVSQVVPEASSLEEVHIPEVEAQPEPDTTSTVTPLGAVITQARARPSAARLSSVTDEDLHRFLEENDDDDDLDSTQPVTAAAHAEDDDLLNELDDFLNS